MRILNWGFAGRTDPCERWHASTKPETLRIGCLATAALRFEQAQIANRIGLVVVEPKRLVAAVAITAASAAFHIINRAAEQVLVFQRLKTAFGHRSRYVNHDAFLSAK